MNVTLMLQQSIGAAVRKIRYNWVTQQQPQAPTVQVELPCRNPAGRPLTASSRQSATAHTPIQNTKPLRVLRFVEGGMPRTSVGRMVMSGSMADVCAELDRLAAQELAVH